MFIKLMIIFVRPWDYNYSTEVMKYLMKLQNDTIKMLFISFINY